MVLGPTATGKSDLGLELARTFGGEIISADSVQVYRLMDIGTAKPPEEVRREVRHHMIDVVWPDEEFSAGDFRRLARKAIEEILLRGRIPIVVGGTGLYIKALTEGLIEGLKAQRDLREELLREARAIGSRGLWERLREIDPRGAEAIHPNDLYRIIRALEIHHLSGLPPSSVREGHGFGDRPYDLLKVGLIRPRKELYRRIDQRVEQMIKGGLVEEVKGLLKRGYGEGLISMKAIGYKEILKYLRGEISLDEAVRLMKRNTRHLAKRQITWFKRDPEIQWFRYPEERERIFRLVAEFLGRAGDGTEGAQTH